MAGYTNKTDTDLVSDFVLQSPDVYMSKYEYIGTAALSTTTPNAHTLTPATAPVWAADEFNSTQAKNLYLLDDNDAICSCAIDDTTLNTSITFDEDDLLLLSDGVTAATLTDETTYDIQIRTKNNTYEWGDFMGYLGDGNYEESEETVAFHYGVPKRKIREDLISSDGKLTANLFSTENTLIKALRNMESFGLQTTEIQYAKGFVPSARDFYQIVLIGEDVDGKATRLVLLMGQFALGGSESLYGEDYKSLPFEFRQVANEIFPDNADKYFWAHTI